MSESKSKIHNIFSRQSIAAWFKEHFFFSKSEFKMFLFFTTPIILSSFFYSLNGFIDNFMVTHIPGGLTALNYANGWTGILYSIYIGINIVGSMLYGQFRGMNNESYIKSLTRLRYFLSFFISAVFCIFASIMPERFIHVFSGNKAGHLDVEGIENGIIYIRYIAFVWLITSITFVNTNIMREIGVSKFVLYAILISITTNVVLNYLFMHVWKYGVNGAAIATIISQSIFAITNTIFLFFKKRFFLVNFLLIWKIDRAVWMYYLKRVFTVVIASASIIFVALRTAIWSRGLPAGSIGATQWNLGAAAVLAMTSTITNILTASYPSISSTISTFVGKNLGNNKLDKAMYNAKKIRGFNFIFSTFFSITFIIILIVIPYITYFSSGFTKEVQNNLQNTGLTEAEISSQVQEAGDFYMKQIQLTLIPILFFNPFWIWVIATSRILGSGGQTNKIAIIDMSFNGIHFLFLVFLSFVVAEPLKNNVASESLLPLLVFFFFAFEVVFKTVIYEILFHKIKWNKKLENK
ncbi:MATE family efflux transporter [Candidatus Mycoplasma pogonae]